MFVCILCCFAGALVQIQVIRLACSFTATLMLILLAWSPSQPVRRDRNHVYTGLGPVPPAEIWIFTMTHHTVKLLSDQQTCHCSSTHIQESFCSLLEHIFTQQHAKKPFLGSFTCSCHKQIIKILWHVREWWFHGKNEVFLSICTIWFSFLRQNRVLPILIIPQGLDKR